MRSSRSSSAPWPRPRRGAARRRSIAGEAGIGKTSLVRALARRVGARRASAWRRATTSSPRARSARCAMRRRQRRSAGGRAGRGRPVTRLRRAAGGARARSGRRCWSSRTSTGPTTPRSTCSATRRGGWRPLGARAGADRARRGSIRGIRCTGCSACSRACPVHRLELAPLSRGAVQALAAGTGRDAAAVHALTRGNPFFVAEALAAPPRRGAGERQGRGAGAAAAGRRRSAARRWSGCRWCPRRSRPSWPRAARRRCDALAEAELAGLIEARAGRARLPARARAARDRAEPARRSGGGCSTRPWSGAARAGAPERARLLHHAAEAGDVDTLLAEGPAAAREAARAGLAPAGARALRGGDAHADAPAAAPSGRRAQRLRLGALQRARFREAVRRRARGARGSTRARRLGRAGVVPRAAVAAAVHGRARPTRPRRAPQRAVRAARARATTRRSPTRRCIWARSWR